MIPIKALMFDLETSPNVVETFSLKNAFIPIQAIRKPTRMICWAARWVGDKTMHFSSEFGDGKELMARRLHALMSEADVLIGYNSKRFDVPVANWAFIKAGLTPPAPSRHIDLYQVARKNFRSASQKLDFLAQELEIGAKVAHEGGSLWSKCLAGDADAWARMEEYNKQDVDLLEDLYLTLRPWIHNHPPVALFSGNTEKDTCPNCESEDLRREGYALTNLGRFQRFQCRQCGTWTRSGKRVDHVDIRGVAA